MVDRFSQRLGGTVYSTLIEPHRVDVTHVAVPLPGLPRALDGLTIAHLTDLHRSTLISRQYLDRCVARANTLAPDLILVTGDYLPHGHSPRGELIYAGRRNQIADCRDVGEQVP